MIKFVADEDLDGHIVRSLRRHLPQLDITRVQDAHLRSASDEDVLEWAAQANRIVLSHDASSMTAWAYRRIAVGRDLPGVLIVPQWLSIGEAVADLALIAECSAPEEWFGQVRFLPLV